MAKRTGYVPNSISIAMYHLTSMNVAGRMTCECGGIMAGMTLAIGLTFILDSEALIASDMLYSVCKQRPHCINLKSTMS